MRLAIVCFRDCGAFAMRCGIVHCSVVLALQKELMVPSAYLVAAQQPEASAALAR